MSTAQPEFPTIQLMDTIYEVDIHKDCLVEKGFKEDTIPFKLFEYKGTYYELDRQDAPDHMNWTYAGDTIVIPQKVELDPVGMALKYNVSLDEISMKSDYDLIVDQQMYNDRVNNDMMPVIDIAGQKFRIDLRFEKLKSTTDPSIKIELNNTLDCHGDLHYGFYFHRGTKQAVKIDHTITSLPPRVVWVEIPWDDKLDPVAVARREDLDIKNYLVTHPFEKELKAKVVPLSETGLAELVKRNKAALDKGKGVELLKKYREWNGKGKGKHQ
jgi:hypothetical protein